MGRLSLQVCAFGLCVFALLLAGCTPALTYAETVATAQVAGCWPDTYPTPRAVTVTPDVALLTPSGTPATTTPYPRCAPAPGATAIPWPMAVPPPPPFPTMLPRTWQGGSAQKTTLQLPEKVLAIDLAAHPTEGWPAAISAVWSGDDRPDRVFVSVYNPRANQWSHARQVDVGDSQIGRYSRTVAVTITLQGEVVAAWGMSDPDFQTGEPPSGIWTASSSDFGETWTAPVRIATDCRRVNGIAVAMEGTIAASLVCPDGPQSAQPAMVVRSPDGEWQQPERLPIPVWQYSEGAIVASGEGQDARFVAIVLAGQNGSPTAYLVSRPVAGGAWQVARKAIALQGAPEIGTRMWHSRALAYDRLQADGSTQPTVTFVWTGGDAPSGVYALTSTDGGISWGDTEAIAFFGAGGAKALYAASAYDPAADRLVTLWTCCADASWTWAESTHYARWSIPASGVWQTPGGEPPEQLIPLALGSRSAADTASAQARGIRSAWMAWVDTLARVEIRSIDLDQLIPVEAYPTVTPIPQPPTATIGGS